MEDDLFNHREQNGNLNNSSIKGEQIDPRKSLSKNSADYLLDLISNSSDIDDGLKASIPEIVTLQAFGIKIHDLVKLSTQTCNILEIYNSSIQADKKALIAELLQTVAYNIDIITAKIKQALKEYKDNAKDSSHQIYDEEYKIEFIDLARLAASVFEYKLSFFVSREDIQHQTNIADAIQTLTTPPADPDTIYRNILADFIRNSSENKAERSVKCTSLSPHLIRSIIKRVNQIYTDITQDKNHSFDLTQDGYNINLTWGNSTSLNSDKRNALQNALTPLKSLLTELGGDLNFLFSESNTSITITCPAAEDDVATSDNLSSLTAGYVRIK